MTRGIPPVPETIDVENTDPVYSTVADLRTIGDATVRVSNDTNKTVAVTIQTAAGDDRAFSHPCETGAIILSDTSVGGVVVSGFFPSVVSSMDVPAGDTIYASVSGSFAFARVKGVAAEVPAAASELAVAWTFKHRGD